MTFTTILIIFALFLATCAYLGINEAQKYKKHKKAIEKRVTDKEIIEIKREIERERDRERNKDKKEIINDVVDDVKEEREDKYTILSKSKNELNAQEFNALKNQYRAFLEKQGGESFDQSLKENSRIFIAYDKNGVPIGQAAVLILDTHDFWGAFSKIRNLNLDAQSVILYNVCVIPEHRKRGVADRILREIHMWAQQNGKPKVVLFVDPMNRNAIRLYERLGYSLDKSHYAPNGAEVMMRINLH